MSQYDRNMSQRTTNTGEVSYDPGDLFYSRTDERGVIIEGNQLFRRVSGYGWQEIKGAPHKIVRHPDMPKGVFQLMWDRLKADQKMVAYVKNRAKDGRYYWVTALTWPIEEGYLSVRLKPVSNMRDKVEKIYRDLKTAEETEGLTPAKSADRLLEQLLALGFSSFDHFMSDTLRAEIEQTAKLTHMQLPPVVWRFFAMSDTMNDLRAEVDGLVEVVSAIRTVPMNMRILASRLENVGGPISAISVNYTQMLEEMTNWVKEFTEGQNCTFARIHDSILHGQFLVCASFLQDRMSEGFAADIKGAADQSKLVEDKATLEREAEAFRQVAHDSLGGMEREVRRLSRSVLDMKRYVTGLSSTRMMCKIESATLADTDTALSGIVEQLDERQNEIERRLAKVVELNGSIQGNCAMLKSLL
jgi:aerotaxis receptor